MKYKIRARRRGDDDALRRKPITKYNKSNQAWSLSMSVVNGKSQSYKPSNSPVMPWMIHLLVTSPADPKTRRGPS